MTNTQESARFNIAVEDFGGVWPVIREVSAVQYEHSYTYISGCTPEVDSKVWLVKSDGVPIALPTGLGQLVDRYECQLGFETWLATWYIHASSL